MCVYILSEDVFFSSGLACYLSSQGVHNEIIPSDGVTASGITTDISRNDIVIVDIDMKFCRIDSVLFSTLIGSDAAVVLVFDTQRIKYAFGARAPMFLTKKCR